MKSKIKRHSRSVISVLLAVCMLVSCMTVGIIATDAARISADEAVGASNPVQGGNLLVLRPSDWQDLSLIAGGSWRHQDNFTKGFRGTNVTGTDFYYMSLSTVGDNNATTGGGWFFVDGNYGNLNETGNDVWYINKANECQRRTTEQNYGFSSGSYYISVISGSGNSCSVSTGSASGTSTYTDNISGNTSYKFNQTLKVAIKGAGESSYTEKASSNATTGGTVQISGKNWNTWNSVTDAQSTSSNYSTTLNNAVKTSYISLSASPFEGYEFIGFYDSLNGGNSVGNSIKVNSANTYYARFEKLEDTHPVSYSAYPEVGGTATGPAQIGEETAQNVTANANAGYTFSSWTFGSGIDYDSTSANPTAIKTKSSGNYTVQANFSINYYTLSSATPTNGTFTAVAANPDSNGKVPYGDTVTVTCMPATGYIVSSVTCGSATASESSTNVWTFDMPAADTEVSVGFAKADYGITKTAVPAGVGTVIVAKSSDGADVSTYNIGDTLYPRVEITDNAYELSNFTVTYANSTTATVAVGGSIDMSETTGAITVQANFALKTTYAVTATSNDTTLGTVSVSPASAYEGQTVTVTYTEGTGVIKGMTADVEGVTLAKGAGTTYTFTMPGEAVNITATFALPTVRFKSNGDGGTVTATAGGAEIESGATVNKGTSVTFTAEPETDYYFDKWSGGASGTTTPTTVTVNSDISVTGNFVEKGYFFVSAANNNAYSVRMTEIPDSNGLYITSDKYASYRFQILSEKTDKVTQASGHTTLTANEKKKVNSWADKSISNTNGYTGSNCYDIPSGGPYYVVYDSANDMVYCTTSDKGYYPVTVYLKTGTYRSGDMNKVDTNSGEYKQTGDFGSFTVVKDGSSTGTDISLTNTSGYTVDTINYIKEFSVTADEIEAGKTIYLKAECDADKGAHYYIQAFDVQGIEKPGLSRSVIKQQFNNAVEGKPAIWTDDRIPESGQAYNELTLDIPAYTEDKIVITLIYAPKVAKKTDMVRFKARNFAGSEAYEKWGGYLAVYPYIENAYAPFGGYPGQLMVYENGEYFSDVPSHDINNPDAWMQGLTMNNYTWDDFVYDKFLKSKANAEFAAYTSYSDNDKRQSYNRQTFDYNEFSIITQLFLASTTDRANDAIIFNFKYKANPSPDAGDRSQKAGYSASNLSMATYFDNDTDDQAFAAKQLGEYGYRNAAYYSFTEDEMNSNFTQWEDVKNYYGDYVDIFGEEVTDAKKNYNPIRIISNGNDHNSVGYYATAWALYFPANSSNQPVWEGDNIDHYELFDVIGGCGQTKTENGQTVWKNGSESFLIDPAHTARIHLKYGDYEEDSVKETYWKDLFREQNNGSTSYPRHIFDCENVPVKISYEYEIMGLHPNEVTGWPYERHAASLTIDADGEVHLNEGNSVYTKWNWGSRSDGYWTYSDSSRVINAHTIVETATKQNGTYTRDYFQTGDVDYTDTTNYDATDHTTVNSSVKAYFDNTNTVIKSTTGEHFYNVAGNTLAYSLGDGLHTLSLHAEEDPKGDYIFKGWYLQNEDPTKEPLLVSTELECTVPANTNEVYIARFYKSAGTLKLTHALHPDSKGDSDTVTCTTQVNMMNGDVVVAAIQSDPKVGAVPLTGKYIRVENAEYTLQIVITTTFNEGQFVFDGFWDDVVADGVYAELGVHGVITAVTTGTKTATITIPIGNLFDGEGELKLTSIDFFSKVSLPTIKYSTYYEYDSRQYGQQKYLVQDYFQESDFENYLVWDNTFETDDSKTGWYKMKDDTKAEFFALHCPFESNLRRVIKWDYPSAIKTNQYYYNNEPSEISSTITASSDYDTDARVQFKFPYLTRSTDAGTVAYDRLYAEDKTKVCESDASKQQVTENDKTVTYSKYLTVKCDYRYPYYLNRQAVDTGAAPVYVSAEPVIYDSTGETAKNFQYWSVKTIPADGSPVDASGSATYDPDAPTDTYRSYEIARCYNYEFNLTTYQDCIVEARYAENIPTSREHETGATITHVDTARNQWNIDGGKGSASTSIGDRIFSNFIIGFDRADKLRLNTASSAQRQYFQTGLLIDRIETIPSANGLAENAEGAWTVKSEKEYYDYYNTGDGKGTDPNGTTAASAYLTANHESLSTGPSSEPTANGQMYAVSNIALNKLDNKNKIEFTKAFPNIFTSAGDGHEAGDNTGRKNYVYRAYAYMMDYNVLDSAGNVLSYDSSKKVYYYMNGAERIEVAMDAEGIHKGSIKQLTVSDPVYFTFYDIASISNAVNQSTNGGSAITVG